MKGEVRRQSSPGKKEWREREGKNRRERKRKKYWIVKFIL